MQVWTCGTWGALSAAVVREGRVWGRVGARRLDVRRPQCQRGGTAQCVLVCLYCVLVCLSLCVALCACVFESMCGTVCLCV